MQYLLEVSPSRHRFSQFMLMRVPRRAKKKDLTEKLQLSLEVLEIKFCVKNIFDDLHLNEYNYIVTNCIGHDIYMHCIKALQCVVKYLI